MRWRGRWLGEPGMFGLPKEEAREIGPGDSEDARCREMDGELKGEFRWLEPERVLPTPPLLLLGV